MSLNLVVIRGSDKYYITNMCTEYVLSGDIETYHRTLEVSCKNTKDGKKRLFSFKNGELYVLYVDKKEAFRGYLFNHTEDSTGIANLTIYDANIYLLKNEETLLVKEKKASDVAKDLCKKFGISIGKIDDTKKHISKLVFNGNTLEDIIKQCLENTSKNVEAKFSVYSSKGKFYLLNRATSEKVAMYFTDVISSTNSKGIEDTRTQIKIVKGSVEESYKSVVVKNDKRIKTFGLMQYVESVDDKADMNAMANTLLKELQDERQLIEVTLPGDISCVTGKRIDVKNDLSRILGAYFITSDRHTFSDGNHAMTLQLSKKM